ncbi:MAG: tRNA (N6-threonylcarbamoyladenosine(37)-N6)-methyltransferase TrmO [Spirochaetota bacterium]
METIRMRPIGYVATEHSAVPRFYTISDVQGELIIDESLQDGLRDIEVGSTIIVLFYFHQSPQFRASDLRVVPPSRQDLRGVFSTRSPVRPNPIGLSRLTVTYVRGNRIGVLGLDMIEGTPILDIKPCS